ncbi:transcriptional repressor [Limosilactobacillus gastricus]|uniref:Ferric uptake regulator n=1 Tax=Limosilactobacillus gastricus DSM 16045 TaxID=1423749 RepID=A0A0R1VAS8_9LACO|nr:Fur family transcriptional regulator [Limosilactobacillus gastricus]KRM02632.1 Ferric uptake regulator [Limosilactobacillus gastricus DSM 16045]QGF40699.1 transcriptional repressor [Limosilactobacillus gastricus]
MSEAEEYQHALDILHQNHVRLTSQRKLILNYLVTHHTHPSVEMIYDDLQDTDASISIATIYNTLNLLIDQHLIIELSNGDGSTHYDYFGTPHFHVVCDRCGKITDVFDDEYRDMELRLRQVAAKQTEYLVTKSDVEVHGICPECQQKEA